jgi:putative YphP/YqiW family bacilliredoxin
MYPEAIVKPMKAELVSAGFEDLTTPESVSAAINSQGTVLVVVNSVCGCAAGAARPGVRMAVAEGGKRPGKLATVFAGFDTEAVMEARKHFAPYPASSPSIALFKDGKLVHFVERHHIEGRSAQMIADHLKTAFDEYC